MGNTKRVEGYGQYKRELKDMGIQRELKDMGNTKRVEGNGQYKES